MIELERYDYLDTAEPAAVREIQNALLREHLRNISLNSAHYKSVFSSGRIDPGGIGLDELSTLPFTDKKDIEESNDEFLSVPFSEIGDIVLSSGTTGKPTRMMYSNNDLKRLAYNEKTAFKRIGVSSEDTVLLTCTMDRCFVAGLAYYLGVRALGAAAIRNGLNSPESHMGVIERMGPTVIVGVPSFLHKLGLFMKGNGLDPAETPVKKLVCIGEPLRDKGLSMLPRGIELEALWGGKVYSTYASSEAVTTFCECESQCGGHMHPALAVIEVVDDDGKPLRAGEVGEVVITPLLTDGMPLLRFKTGDVSFLVTEPCACGRTSPRLGPIIGRKKQMIKLRGTTIYPQAIFSVLDGAPEIGEYYVTVSSDYDLSDIVCVHVSVRDGACSAGEIGRKLQTTLRVKPDVLIEEEAEIRKTVYSENSRKPVRFIDRRKS